MMIQEDYAIQDERFEVEITNIAGSNKALKDMISTDLLASPNREKIGLPALLSTKMCLRCNAQEALSGPSSSYRFMEEGI